MISILSMCVMCFGARMQSLLVNVPHRLEKDVCYATVEWSRLWMSIQLTDDVIELKHVLLDFLSPVIVLLTGC